MKIQFDNDEIRIRLTEAEFDQLKSNQQLVQNFSYLPLLTTIEIVAASGVGSIGNSKLALKLTAADLLALINPENKKSGVKLLVNTLEQQEICVDLQVDLHPKK